MLNFLKKIGGVLTSPNARVIEGAAASIGVKLLPPPFNAIGQILLGRISDAEQKFPAPKSGTAKKNYVLEFIQPLVVPILVDLGADPERANLLASSLPDTVDHIVAVINAGAAWAEIIEELKSQKA